MPDTSDPGAGSLLPAVLGGNGLRLPSGPLWDAERLEGAALRFLSTEDPAGLVEALRYLFRATLAAGMDPVPLLMRALGRRKAALHAEVAELVRAHLDRDLGRALDDLFSADTGRRRNAIYFLAERPDGEPGKRALALPALTAMLAAASTDQHATALRQVVEALPRILPPGRVARSSSDSPTEGREGNAAAAADPDVMEGFLDAILDFLDDLEAPEKFTVSRFLLGIQAAFPPLPDYLFRRMRATADPQLQAFFGNVLARSALAEDPRSECARFLVDVFLQHGSDTALQDRLKATFILLGAEPLALLCDPPLLERMSAVQRTWLADLWAAYLAAGAPRPPDEGLAAFAIGEIGARNRAALISMIRSGLLRHASLQTYLRENDWARPTVIQVLLDEAARLEDPDDLGVLAFLGALGFEAVEAAFERAQDEAALDSRSAAWRFRVFAQVAFRAALDPARQGALADWCERALAFPFLNRTHLPATLDGLGALGRIPGLPQPLLDDVLRRILPEDEAPSDRSLRLDSHPSERMQSVLAVYRGGATPCPEAVRTRIEARLEAIVADEGTPRPVLVAALEALDAIVQEPDPPLRVEATAVMLARIVLRKSREASLDAVLQDALRDDAEGTGVRMCESWNKEDRDRALDILGRVAAHPGVPEALHRMVTARLAGFLEDWLDAQESAKDLYQYRETPLWRILTEIVRARPTEHSVEAVVRLGLRAMEVHRKAPQNFGLERREEAQRLLAELIGRAPQEPVEVRGSLRLDIPQAALQTLLTLATRENPTALRVLEDAAADERFPVRLRGKLDAFLAFSRRSKR